MKKLFFSLMLVVMSINVMGQTNDYEKCTRELLEIGTSSYSPKQMKETLKSTLQGVAEQLQGLMSQLGVQNVQNMPDVNGILNGMFDEVLLPYFDSGEFTNDMVAIMSPMLEKEFTLEEMNQLLDLYHSEEGQQVLTNMGKISANVSETTSKMTGELMALATGGEVPAVERVECPEEYRKVFEKYYELTVAPSIKKSMEKGQDLNNPAVEKVQKYMAEAMPETILRLTYSAVTLDELKQAVDFCNHPLIQRNVQANATLDESSMKPFTDKFNARLQSFLSKFMPGM